MPTIINGYLTRGRRRYTPAEAASRAGILVRNPDLLTIRDFAWGIYLAYVAYVTYFTLRSLAYLLFEQDERHRWCPANWKVPATRWDCFRLLRGHVFASFWALAYEVFAWGFVGAVGTFIMEEVVRWARRRR